MNKTGISWTDLTWNPVSGCSKVSPGCQNCYAEAWSHRWGRSFDVTLHPEKRPLDALKDRDEPWMLSHTPSDFIDGELVGFHSAEIDHRYGIKTPFEKGSIEKIWSNVPLGPMTTLLEALK